MLLKEQRDLWGRKESLEIATLHTGLTTPSGSHKPARKVQKSTRPMRTLS